MSTATRVIKNTGYLYAKMGITMFVSLYTTRLILNGLGAADFGIFNIVGGAIAMLGFLNAAMANATQRFMSYAEGEGNKEKQKYIFNTSIILHTAIAIIAGILLLVTGHFFFNGILNIPDGRMDAAQVVYGSLIVSTLFTVLSVPYDAMLNAHENMRYYASIGILESFLKLVVAFACIYSTCDKLIIYGILMACIPLITLSIMRIYCHRHYEECFLAPKRYYDKALVKEMTGYAGWNFVGSASSMVGNYGQGIILNHFFGTILNAALGIANQLNGLLMVFSNNMLKAINPTITKSEGSGQRERMIEQATLACKYSFALLSILAIPIIIEMQYVLGLWLKNIPEWAVIFCQLQLVRALIEQTYTAYGTAINSEGHIKRYNQMSAIINVIPIPFIAALFHFGASPVAMYAVTIGVWGIVYGLLRIYFMKRNCGMGFRYYARKLLMPSLTIFTITFVLALLPKLMLTESFVRVLATTIVSSVVFLILFFILGMSQEERAFSKSLITKWKPSIFQ